MSDRRSFIKSAGLAVLPGITPIIPAIANVSPAAFDRVDEKPWTTKINFVSDGEILSPRDYVNRLVEIDRKSAIESDSYGSGGPVAALEKKFASITGKQKAVYMPTGTMANQFAIAALSGANTKVFVQETSHVYRDEADAAQSVHNKRLIPLAKGETYFTLDDLRAAITYHNDEEVFRSGIGAVSIENPVRRSNGAQIPLEDLKKISEWCRGNNIKLHLDGARLFLAAAYSGVPIKTYCSLFDTVYISLYKYFGATGGAVLCGDAELIEKMEHQIKIFGGTMYQSWPQAAMALSNVDGFESRFKSVVQKSAGIFAVINEMPEIKITPWPNGSNIFQMKFAEGISTKKFSETMSSRFDILISGYLRDGIGRLAVNESILNRSEPDIARAFKESLAAAK